MLALIPYALLLLCIGSVKLLAPSLLLDPRCYNDGWLCLTVLFSPGPLVVMANDHSNSIDKVG